MSSKNNCVQDFVYRTVLFQVLVCHGNGNIADIKSLGFGSYCCAMAEVLAAFMLRADGSDEGANRNDV